MVVERWRRWWAHHARSSSLSIWVLTKLLTAQTMTFCFLNKSNCDRKLSFLLQISQSRVFFFHLLFSSCLNIKCITLESSQRQQYTYPGHYCANSHVFIECIRVSLSNSLQLRSGECFLGVSQWCKLRVGTEWKGLISTWHPTNSKSCWKLCACTKVRGAEVRVASLTAHITHASR